MDRKQMLEIIAEINEQLAKNDYHSRKIDDNNENDRYYKRYENNGIAAANAWSCNEELNAIMREIMEYMNEDKN